MSIALVVAADSRGGIAKDGDLPWHLPGDLGHFKRVTTATRDVSKRNAVIMGRKTWETIPQKYRPLSHRYNIVVSRQPEYSLPEGVLLAAGLPQAIEKAQKPPRVHSKESGTDVPTPVSVESVFIVGGAQIYSQSIEMAVCTKIYYTRIHKDFDCDVFFPSFESRFALNHIMGHHVDGETRYQVEVWDRK